MTNPYVTVSSREEGGANANPGNNARFSMTTLPDLSSVQLMFSNADVPTWGQGSSNWQEIRLVDDSVRLLGSGQEQQVTAYTAAQIREIASIIRTHGTAGIDNNTLHLNPETRARIGVASDVRLTEESLLRTVFNNARGAAVRE